MPFICMTIGIVLFINDLIEPEMVVADGEKQSGEMMEILMVCNICNGVFFQLLEECIENRLLFPCDLVLVGRGFLQYLS